MFVATHAAIGALIGESLPTHPILAFALAFVIHFFTDMIPHGDTHLYKGYTSGGNRKKAVTIQVIDSLVMIAFVIYLFTRVVIHQRMAVVMGVVGGILPDALAASYEIFHFKWLKGFHRMHLYLHNFINKRTGDLPLVGGMIMEVGILTTLLFFVI